MQRLNNVKIRGVVRIPASAAAEITIVLGPLDELGGDRRVGRLLREF
jgi:hypothetical protein